ncbi:MAG: radical SAM family heme chaperone HemW [Bacteroidetes bacterium]|nr:radical SAM family heme chaperone HemW [Bacteroidota bacterium]
MAGIYLHLPFCRKACHYCNFHFSTSLRQKNDFTEALLKEMALRQNYLTGHIIETIYLGGGTPSLLEQDELLAILDRLRSLYEVHPQAEVTLEANPDDIDTARLKGWRRAGINRLSIGIQSFFEEDLQWMNRAHTAVQAESCIRLAKSAGFDNLTIDLIYGTPGLTKARWEQNVQKALSLGIPHLSCYALTVEPGTALDKMIALQKKEAVQEEAQAEHFQLLMGWMEQAGYEHYEISNFAKPGFRSRHNTSYWQGKPYLGLGPSAHSYNGMSRQWNVANNALYIQSLQKDMVPFEAEELGAAQRQNEYIMISLRTMEGIDLGRLEREFGSGARARVMETARASLDLGQVLIAGERLILTKKGKLFADGIAADLFA